VQSFLTNRIVDYARVAYDEHVRISKSTAGVVDKTTDYVEAMKEAEKTTGVTPETISAWKDWAKSQFEFVEAGRARERAYEDAIATAVKNRGVIDDTTAAILSETSAHKTRKEYSEKFGKLVLKNIKLAEKEEKERKKKDKGMKRQGMRYSWLGYRMFSMGRILQKWILAPLRGAVKVMANWESSIEQAAVTMALAEYYGMDLGTTIDDTAEYFREFAEEGQRTQTSLGSLKLLMGDMAKDMGLSNMIERIVLKLRELWQGIKDTIGVEGFKGLIIAATLATTALIVFGSAIFFLTPIAGLLGVSLGTILTVLGLITAAIATIIIHWDDLKKTWDTIVTPAIKRLKEALGGLNIEFDKTFGWMDLLKGATQPIANVMKQTMDSVADVANIFSFAAESVTGFLDNIKDMGSWVSKLFGHSIGKDITADLSPAIQAMKALQAQMGGPIGFGGASMQAISIYPEISLAGATISSEVDLMQITDAAERGISEALRRRAYPRWSRR